VPTSHHPPSRPIDLNLPSNAATSTATTPRAGVVANGTRQVVDNGGADIYRSSTLSRRLPLSRGTIGEHDAPCTVPVGVGSQGVHGTPVEAAAVSMTGTGNSDSNTSTRTTGIGFPYRASTAADVRSIKTASIGSAYYTIDRRATPASQTTLGPPLTDVPGVTRSQRPPDNADTYCVRCATGDDAIDDSDGCRCQDNDGCARGSCDHCRRLVASTSGTFGTGSVPVAASGRVGRSGLTRVQAAYGGVNDVFFELDGSAAGFSADLFDAERHASGRSPVDAGGGGLLRRLAVAVFVGQLIGVVLFMWMFCHLDYGLTVSAAVGSTSAVVVCLLSAASRACRTVGALALPSLGTGEGRLAFVIIAIGALLAGPVSNVYVNMEEVSRAMGCSAEQSYNQTMFLLQPFDAMMTQLNWTIGGLQDAATNIGRGLKPLEDGLGTVEMYLDNGKLQLYGTRKVRTSLSARYQFL